MAGPFLARLHERWRTLCYWVREYFGENDYAQYVAEWQARHPAGGTATPNALEPPGHHLMTEREFFTYRLGIKYGTNFQRC